MPIEEIVAHVDVEGIVSRIDLVGVIRESTSSLTAEAVDVLRDQGMGLDALSAKIVDRLLFRKRARKVDVAAR